jgi:hypothetical protein
LTIRCPRPDTGLAKDSAKRDAKDRSDRCANFRVVLITVLLPGRSLETFDA